MRLIDADKVMDALYDSGIELYRSEYEEFQKKLDEIPTIEGPELLRPTAHWENEEDFNGDPVVWFCSACKERFFLYDGTPEEINYKYCPYCGAKCTFNAQRVAIMQYQIQHTSGIQKGERNDKR